MALLKKLNLDFCLKCTALFFTYLITAILSLKLDAVSGFATLFWPPTGLSFAALYLLGIRLWPGIFLGALIANLLAGAPVVGCLGIAFGNTLEAIFGVFIFQKFAGPESSLARLKDVSYFVVLVAGVSTIISSSVGVTSLFLSGVISEGAIFRTWGAWWTGDTLSNLVIAPLCLIIKNMPRFRQVKYNKLEAFTLGITVIGICILVFGFSPKANISLIIKPYWIFPLLIWTTIRFGHYANILLVFMISGFAIFAATQNLGPFEQKSLQENLIELQSFIFIVSVTGLFFRALGIEREEALQLRIDFLSMASHELRTPITTLALKFEVLKTLSFTSAFKNDPEMMKRNMDSCAKQLNRLSTLVDDFLDISRIESGRLKINLKVIDLEPLVREVAESLSAQQIEYGCKLELHLEKDVRGHYDPYRLEQLLCNLFNNSMKYGAKLPIVVTLTKKENVASIKVQDFGTGISKEDHERIFERFERVNTDYNIKGLGLGLYISKQIVELHGGEIFVESEIGKGATFTVNLPCSGLETNQTHF